MTASPTPSSPISADAAAMTAARILVVDDQPANIQVLGTVLGKLGHEIIPATDGVTALKRLALRKPDLILLDLLMPDMDGYETCRRLRENPDWVGIPIIFLSAADDKDFIVRALESGGVDYITKPFNQAELVSRVRTQLALKSARDRLTQLAEDKDELLGILAHDLKSHLGGMEMSAQLLHGRIASNGDAKSQQLAENIMRTSGQVLSFVKEYLANAAADHGISVNPIRMGLADVAAATIKQYEESARRKKITIEAELERTNTMVLADSTALDQVLDNLMSNALKFSPPGKHVYVSVKPVTGMVECRIRDEGPGFTPEDQARMFNRYGRLSARPTSGEPSTGLGLSIVRKLVQSMNGQVACESTPGAGATMIVRLPAATTTGT